MPDENVERARRIIDAWNEDDLDAAVELVDPAGELHFSELVFPGLDSAYHGHEGFRKWWRDAKEPFEYWRSEPIEFFSEGDRVVASVHFEAKGAESGVPVELDLANYWVFRDGLVVRFEGHPSLESALAAAGITGSG